MQCVKDFPVVLLALYKRGRAISFSSFGRNLSVVVFVDKTNTTIALRFFRHFVLRQFVKDA